MLGPVHAGSHELDNGRVHDVDRAFGTSRGAAACPAGKALEAVLQMAQNGPEELLGHRTVT